MPRKPQYKYPKVVKDAARKYYFKKNEETGKHEYSNNEISKKLASDFKPPTPSESTVSDWAGQKDRRGVSWRDLFEASRHQGMTEAQIEIIGKDPTAIENKDVPGLVDGVSALNKEIYQDAYKGYKKAIQYVLENDFIYMKDAIEAIKVFKDILIENKDAMKDQDNKEVLEGVILLLKEINGMRQQDAIDVQNARAQEIVENDRRQNSG